MGTSTVDVGTVLTLPVPEILQQKFGDLKKKVQLTDKQSADMTKKTVMSISQLH